MRKPPSNAMLVCCSSNPQNAALLINIKLFLLFISLSSLFSIYAGALPADGDPNKIQLMRHSIESPSIVDPNDWELGGAAQIAGQRISLSPGNAGYSGHLFSKTPILTPSFEVEFTFEISNAHGEPKPSNPRTEGLALWLSPHSLPTLHGMNQNQNDWNLFGHLNHFPGFGAFFAMHDRTNKLNPSISAAHNDGKRQLNPIGDIPTNSGVYWKIRDGGEPMVFKLTVQPNSVLGQARFLSSQKWTDTFKLDVSLPVGSYLGFTADSGQPGPSKSQEDTLSERVTIWDVHTYNLDPKILGEEPSKEFKEVIAPEAVNELLKVNSGEMDVKESLRVISQMMTKLIVEMIPRQNEMSRALQLVEIRLAHLNVDLEEIERHIGAPHQQHEAIATISSQLSGLKQMFDVHSQSQAQAAQSLIDVGRSIHERGQAAQGRHLETIQSHLSKQAYQNWAMFGCLLAAVVVIVGFVWKKTREIEKNHLF